ncbi:MAG: hypothetical protein IPK17_08705 [Chloroflexi bacterium]|uniref:hypothetical protein n=1 Tax=Candidatus Flexifilum breve TaxID=3140694 RepID=UPI003136C32A|nr:hypothetical protein [Chloroflexota bacterium]
MTKSGAVRSDTRWRSNQSAVRRSPSPEIDPRGEPQLIHRPRDIEGARLAEEVDAAPGNSGGSILSGERHFDRECGRIDRARAGYAGAAWTGSASAMSSTSVFSVTVSCPARI